MRKATRSSLTIILFVFSSCNKNENKSTRDIELIKDSTKPKIEITTLNTFSVDDFPVDNEMISHQNDPDMHLKKISGETYSFDKAWFGNTELKQNLVLEMYTDYHRLVIFHFYTDDIPNDLLHRMELHAKTGELATMKQKVEDIDGLLQQSEAIDAKYFTSNKGIQLGMSKQKILKIYGKPDQIVMQNGIEKVEWQFEGDLLFDQRKISNNKPVAKDSYGHHVIMYFKNKKLIAQILYNEIP